MVIADRLRALREEKHLSQGDIDPPIRRSSVTLGRLADNHGANFRA